MSSVDREKDLNHLKQIDKLILQHQIEHRRIKKRGINGDFYRDLLHLSSNDNTSSANSQDTRSLETITENLLEELNDTKDQEIDFILENGEEQAILFTKNRFDEARNNIFSPGAIIIEPPPTSKK